MKRTKNGGADAWNRRLAKAAGDTAAAMARAPTMTATAVHPMTRRTSSLGNMNKSCMHPRHNAEEAMVWAHGIHTPP